MSAWGRWKGLLALAVLTSITGNVMHALLVAPTVYGWGAAISASIAPVFLFWHTHNLITAPDGARRGDWVGAVVITAIALGAFAVSFMGLRELLTTFGFAPAIAVILPLVVDVTIAGASWELMRESATDSPVETAAETAVHADDARTDAPDAGPAYPAGLTWMGDAGPATGDIDVAVETAPEPVVNSDDAGASPHESREQRAWRMHQRGDSQPTIAAALACSQSTVSRMLKRMADGEAAAESAAA